MKMVAVNVIKKKEVISMAKTMSVILGLALLALGILGITGLVSMFQSDLVYVNVGEIVLGGLGLLVGIYARISGKYDQQIKDLSKQTKENTDRQRQENDQLRSENDQGRKDNADRQKQENEQLIKQNEQQRLENERLKMHND